MGFLCEFLKHYNVNRVKAVLFSHIEHRQSGHSCKYRIIESLIACLTQLLRQILAKGFKKPQTTEYQNNSCHLTELHHDKNVVVTIKTGFCFYSSVTEVHFCTCIIFWAERKMNLSAVCLHPDAGAQGGFQTSSFRRTKATSFSFLANCTRLQYVLFPLKKGQKTWIGDNYLHPKFACKDRKWSVVGHAHTHGDKGDEAWVFFP